MRLNYILLIFNKLYHNIIVFIEKFCSTHPKNIQ